MRYERKFILGNLSPSEADTMIKVLPQGFRQAYSDRTVNNVYFDTMGFAFYHENLAGVSPRKKCRVRWYGDLQQETASAVFEIKRKFGQVGDKIRVTLPVWDTRGGLSVDAATRTLRRLLIDRAADLSFCDTGLKPTLINQYRRRYYATSDGILRMTVDWDLSYFFPRGQRIDPLARKPLPYVILEFKYGIDAADRAEQVLSRMPLRVARFSKYTVGVNLRLDNALFK